MWWYSIYYNKGELESQNIKHKNMTCLFQASNVARLGLRGAALAAPFGLVKPVQCFWGSKTEEAPKAGITVTTQTVQKTFDLHVAV